MKKQFRFLFLLSILVAGLMTLSVLSPCDAAEKSSSGQKSAETISAEFDFNHQEKMVQSNTKPVKATSEKMALEEDVSVTKNADKLTANLNQTRVLFRFISIILLLVTMLLSLLFVLKFICQINCSADDIVHATGLILIIFGTIIIVLMVDVEVQLTAAIGVLGAIAGYLFGSLRLSKEGKPPPLPKP